MGLVLSRHRHHSEFILAMKNEKGIDKEAHGQTYCSAHITRDLVCSVNTLPLTLKHCSVDEQRLTNNLLQVQFEKLIKSAVHV